VRAIGILASQSQTGYPTRTVPTPIPGNHTRAQMRDLLGNLALLRLEERCGTAPANCAYGSTAWVIRCGNAQTAMQRSVRARPAPQPMKTLAYRATWICCSAILTCTAGVRSRRTCARVRIAVR
jgi:hypothetical protein